MSPDSIKQMEQFQNDLRANQGSKMSLAARRAGEKSSQHAQLGSIDNQIKPTEVQVRGGSMEARLNRVIGSGKAKKSMGASNGVMNGGAHSEGMALAKHLQTLHGAGFLSDFYNGFKSVIQPVAGLASFIPGPIGMAGKVASGVLGAADALGVGSGQTFLPGAVRKGRGRPRKMCGGSGGGTSSAPPAGLEVEHGIADSQLAPNVRPAVAYGNPPQAVEAFKNNTVGMGRPRKMAGAALAGAAMAGAGKKTRAPSARGGMISKLMKEKGMTLGQASKHLKEHGSA